ncbi:MAG: glycosyltransferase family 4 protein [Bacteroidaceae bacterium]|nr:glycosyltransferase family 4 protein [Bacteroidaceae bacterium]
MKTIVVSAVNIRKGGTLTILRDCLEYLSALTLSSEYRVVALVHKRNLCDYEGIEYIEMPDTIKGWSRRLWCEYVTMYHISRELSPVHLWLSLHDTTPRVIAERRAVYCQTSFPFLKLKLNDWRFDYKIGLFGLFTRLAYRINIKKNDYLIVQAEWLRKGFAKMFGLQEKRFIVAPPQQLPLYNKEIPHKRADNNYTFLYAATPDCHKNFELVCQAAQLLEEEAGERGFKVILTVKGTENRYAQWLHEQWGKVKSIDFHGFMSKDALYQHYTTADCLVFPSRIETWGLPISEFAQSGKPILLANLPYAHETAAGTKKTAFFDPQSPKQLKEMMLRLIQNDQTFLTDIPKREIAAPTTNSWEQLFDVLLDNR